MFGDLCQQIVFGFFAFVFCLLVQLIIIFIASQIAASTINETYNRKRAD